ncbi:hypothetical protein IGI04_026634 [Brassica rapa subsp. trilocularis]|uniref:Ubiquitin-like protease family profile domain-containing protein n=1 Tax=Brassica rapa subsp. trilocularis TaxID=1813537 RepID=A0ABQ7KXU5_BRACM|nr:hypothetical protein IGI04_026634 [Brassica rapa subsp. trilocularis]
MYKEILQGHDVKRYSKLMGSIYFFLTIRESLERDTVRVIWYGFLLADKGKPEPLWVFVPPHPLIKHWIFVMRNDQTPSPIFIFRNMFSVCYILLGRLLMYEASREWLLCPPIVVRDIKTPVAAASILAHVK